MTQFKKMMQEGFEKADPNPDGFVTLPCHIVDDIGFLTHKGARIDLALLSGMVFQSQRQSGESKEVIYNTGEKIVIPEGQFIASMQTVVEDLYFRWTRVKPEEAYEDFMRFYERCKKGFGRLIDGGYLGKVGYVDNRFLGTKGTFWTFEGTAMDGLVSGCDGTPMQDSVFTSLDMVLPDDDAEYANVVDILSTAFVYGSHSDYKSAEISTGIGEGGADRGRYMDYDQWTDLIANGRSVASGDRHVSVGCLIEGQEDQKDTAAYFIPHFIFDVDGDDPFDSFNITHRLVDFFVDDMGVSADDLIVAYTGGSGFHVMLPSGTVGNPIFRNHTKAKNLLLRFKRMYLQEDVDSNLFDPRHMVRMIGSMHNKSGLYKVARTATNFRTMSVHSIITDAVEYKRFEIPDPTKVRPVSSLMLAFMHCADTLSKVTVPRYADIKIRERGGTSEAVEKALQGVAHKQVWYASDTKEYIGRNFAMFVAACHLLKVNDGNEYQAWDELVEVNYKNSPPLPERELRLCLNSAMKTSGYARRR